MEHKIKLERHSKKSDRVLAFHDALGDKNRNAQGLSLMQQNVYPHSFVVKSSQESSSSSKKSCCKWTNSLYLKVADSYLAVFIAPEFGAVGETGDVIGMKYGYRGGPSKAGKKHDFLFSSLLFKNNIY